MFAGAVAMLIAAPQARSSAPQPPTGLSVFAGYTDTIHQNQTGRHPIPWRRSPGVIFKGCNYYKPSRCTPYRDHYDGGALRLQNGTSQSLTVTQARVRIGKCTFRPWPHLHVVLAPGKQLILTQTSKTGQCKTGKGSDFDTSATHHRIATQCTTNDGKIPVFRVVVNGQLLVYRDTAQILNTGGIDPGEKACGFKDETQPWSAL